MEQGSERVTTGLGMPAVPRQFALVLDEDDPTYDEYVQCFQPADRLMWWGVALDDGAVLIRRYDDGRLDTAHHRNADAALYRWSRLYPLKLEWL
ncbi:MAG: hypothetical protein WCA46_18785 [Actinocatenispora sp.]